MVQQCPESKIETIYHSSEELISILPLASSPPPASLLLRLEHVECSPLLGSFLRPLPQLFLRLAPFHQPGLGSNGSTPEKSCFLTGQNNEPFPMLLIPVLPLTSQLLLLMTVVAIRTNITYCLTFIFFNVMCYGKNLV